MRLLFVAAVALAAISPAHSKGELIMCTGAEPAIAEGAAGAAKGAADVGAAAGTVGAANAVGAAGGDALGSLIAGNAGAWGVTVAPELAAGAGGAAAGSASSSGGSGSTLSQVATGASAANAGVGLLSAITAKRPTAPTLAAPILMPTPDDAATQRARNAMLSTMAQRRGRASTILSNPTDTLGN